MKTSYISLIFFAIIVAVIVAIALPGLYFLEDAIGEQSEVEALATLQAAQITKIIKKDSRLWPLTQQQLLTLIEEHALDGDEDETSHSILDNDRRIIVTNAVHALPRPTVSEAVELHNASGLVGYYQVERSLRGLLYETLFVALVGCLLALIIAIPLRTLPLRALRKAFLELEQEREKALIPLASIADAVIMTNAQMIVEYLNPSAEKLTVGRPHRQKACMLTKSSPF